MCAASAQHAEACYSALPCSPFSSSTPIPAPPPAPVCQVGEGVEEWLGGQGLSNEEGALPLQRLLRQQLLGPAAQALLEQRMELAQEAQQQGSMLGMKASSVACRVLVTVGPGGVGLEVQRESLL